MPNGFPRNHTAFAHFFGSSGTPVHTLASAPPWRHNTASGGQTTASVSFYAPGTLNLIAVAKRHGRSFAVNLYVHSFFEVNKKVCTYFL